jgi:hypothetical protein
MAPLFDYRRRVPDMGAWSLAVKHMGCAPLTQLCVLRR